MADTRKTVRKDRREAREKFIRVRNTEKKFVRQLRQVALHVGHIIEGVAPNGEISHSDVPRLQTLLSKYSEMLIPWAESVSLRMIAEVDNRGMKAWTELGREMGRSMRKELAGAPTGVVAKQLMANQVELITSLPLDAAQRVHKLTLEALSDSTRAKAVAKEIGRSGQVTASRAMLIARTEVTRTAGSLLQARAEHVGSEGYVWRTAGDSDVREVHKHLEGKFFKWTEPPVSGEKGERSHPGGIYNCRCWAEPILPDIIE